MLFFWKTSGSEWVWQDLSFGRKETQGLYKFWAYMHVEVADQTWFKPVLDTGVRVWLLGMGATSEL